ncbi:MAG: hypothetical protein AVDCRST_MAG93-576 [uncultured Chloroflexia bacterium]|uniref:Uncharacterized protein n=1 Tax=uncultured Chloroflexia bacterium TaxID=1672391 RepID=A0A6J4HHV3_9CHLR|nr:MAG: hypothetical protein AVDCRST_MAG93-576 [uncultured Chloroflexia bacterium]
MMPGPVSLVWSTGAVCNPKQTALTRLETKPAFELHEAMGWCVTG